MTRVTFLVLGKENFRLTIKRGNRAQKENFPQATAMLLAHGVRASQ